MITNFIESNDNDSSHINNTIIEESSIRKTIRTNMEGTEISIDSNFLANQCQLLTKNESAKASEPKVISIPTSSFSPKSKGLLRRKSTVRSVFFGAQPHAITTQFKKTVPYLTYERKSSLILQLKQAKNKILKKTEEYLQSIQESINSNNIDQIKILMLSSSNKHFYKRQLQASTFLSQMLITDRIDMLQMLLNDPFYVFDELYIFTYLCDNLKQKEQKKHSESFRTIIENVIEMSLFKMSLIKVLAWLICCYEQFDLFIALVKENEREFYDEQSAFNGFLNEEEAMDYYNNNTNFNKTIIICLKEKCEQYAIDLVKFKNQLDCSEVMNTAIKMNSRLFLRFVWEESNRPKKEVNDNDDGNNDGNKKKQDKNLKNSRIRKEFNNGVIVFYVSDLVNKINILLINSDFIYEIINCWSYLDKDAQLMMTLFDIKAYDEISILLYKYPNNPEWKFSQKDCLKIIHDKGIQLTLYCLTLSECLTVLENSDTQAFIVNNYLDAGETIYYAAEMINSIQLSSLDLSLTYSILDKIDQAIKKKKINNCHSPILTCMLLSEIALKIGKKYILYQTHCQRTKNALVTFCKNIYESNQDERYIKYLLMQKDLKGRAAYQIAADPELFTVLDSPEVGTIVTKLWAGRLSYESLLSFSSVYRYMNNSCSKGMDPVDNFIRYDKSKIYYHQFALWLESCQLRYLAEPVNNVLLVILYIIYIDNLTSNDLIIYSKDQVPSYVNYLMYCYITWIIIKCFHILLQFSFCQLTKKRRFNLSIYSLVTFLSLLFSLLLFIDVTYYFPSYDDDGNIIPSDQKSSTAFVVRAIILSLNTICLWVQSTQVFVTFKKIGPLVRMISSLLFITIKYLVIYQFFMICCSTIFISFFYDSSPQFKNYTATFITLFNGFLNNFNCFEYERYQIFGAIMITTFATITGLLLVNLLVALLSNEYVRLSKEVDVAQRSVFIYYFNQYKWDKDYGYLILLPSPVSIINYIVLAVNKIFFRKHQKKFNMVISKVYYLLFIFPLIFILYLIISLLLIPFCYIKSFYWKIIYENHRKGKTILGTFSNIFLYSFLGLGLVLKNFGIDFYDFISTIYVDIDVDTHDLEKFRIKNYITEDDIRTFLQFIHKRDRGEPNDLNNIFIDYLEFEQIRKSEYEQSSKQQSLYLQKLKSHRSKRLTALPLYTFNLNKNKKLGEDGSGVNKEKANERNQFIKRNLIIIETLENFLIDDSSDNFIVDIEKMKMLLPNTMIISNAYKKRLLFTNISSISKAVNRMKKNTDAFLQQKLINKIVGGSIRLDKTIDLPVGNYDPLQSDTAKKNHKIDIQDNEDDYYTTLEEMLNKMCHENADKMKKCEEKIIEDEKVIKLVNKERRDGRKSFFIKSTFHH